MEDVKIKTQIKNRNKTTMSQIKITLDGINSRLDTAEEVSVKTRACQ